MAVASPAAGVTYVFDTPISGDVVSVTLSLTDAAGGDAVDVTLSIPPGEGDLLGLFGNVTDESIVPQMAVNSPTGIITQWQFKANKVFKVGGGNVMSPIQKWDWGLRIDEQGSSGGAIESATFQLTGPGLTAASLTGAANQGYLFGVRIQSTNGAEGSSKIGLADGTPPVGEAPSIQIDAPADGGLLSATPVTVSGTVTGSAPLSVDVNGVAASVSGSTFSASVPLSEGANTLTAVATNASGSDTDAVSVTLDTTPPLVTITTPADGTLTTDASVLVEGTVTDASPIASFTVNGQAVTLTGGAFSTTVPLALGSNPITAVATDAAGNTGQDAVSVERGEAPVVAITAPVDGLLTNLTLVTVSGTVTGTAPVSVDVNGVTAVVTAGSFSADVPLVGGANTLTAVGTNAFGSGTDAVSVTVDITPPVVTITTPADGTLTTDASVLVEGTVTDASPITSFTVNGQAVTLTAGAFSTTVPLVLGANPITAVATDAAGNSGQDAVSVERGEAPVVTITAPADGTLTNLTPVTVTGTVTGTSPVSVDVNGVTAVVTAGSFSADVPLVEGANTLTANASNALGNDTDAVTVTLDITPPVVTITTPADGTLTTDASVLVEGTVTDASPITSFTVNGQAVTLTAGAFSTTVPLVLGANPITAVATDAAGNSGQDAVSVERGEAPVVTITAPADGTLTNLTPVTVTGTVTGTSPVSVDVNGVTAVVTAGSFSADVPLVEGANTLTANASNAFGSDTDAVSVTLDTTPPVVSITLPLDGQEFTEEPVGVVGTVADANPITGLTLNGTPIAPGNAFAETLGLVEGANPITVVATDAAGNTGSDSITVTLSLGPPLTISIDTPPNGALVSTATIPVAGLVSDPIASVDVNGVNGTLAGSSYSAAAVPLVEGPNVITATATRGTDTATDSITVTFNAPPQVVIVSPPSGTVFRQAQSDVQGLVDDPTALVDVNGVIASVDSAGRFFAPDVPLAPGPNELVARAVDTLGATGSDQVDVTRDDAALGKIKIVVVDPERRPFAYDNTSLPSTPAVAGNLQDFRDSLDRAGFPVESFTPPVNDITVGFFVADRIHVYVFTEGGEIGTAVTVPEAALFDQLFQVSGPLLSIDALSGDLFAIGLGNAGVEDLVLPDEFEANGFRRLTLPLEGYGYGGL